MNQEPVIGSHVFWQLDTLGRRKLDDKERLKHRFLGILNGQTDVGALKNRPHVRNHL